MDLLSASSLYSWFTAIISRRGRSKPENSIKDCDKVAILDKIIIENNAGLSQLSIKCFTKKTTVNNHFTNPFSENKGLVCYKKNFEMDEKNQIVDNSNSFEDDIEELLSLASNEENITNINKSENFLVRQRKLFDYDLDENEDQFILNDEELSGKKLAQHFELIEKKSNSNSKLKSKSKFDNENVVDGQHTISINESTIQDVSELEEENSQLYTKSLEIISTPCEKIDRGFSSLNNTLSFPRLPPINTTISEAINENSKCDEYESIEKISINLSNIESISSNTLENSNDDEEINMLKEKILFHKDNSNSKITIDYVDNEDIIIKQMERVNPEVNKEMLDIITEESEKDSIKPGQDIKLPPSGRDSSSLPTTSTEYRAFQEEWNKKGFTTNDDRDNIIEKLTETLEGLIKTRDELQQQNASLLLEIQQIKKQNTDTKDITKKTLWPRDQISAGQRISEFSIELVSESGDEVEDDYITDEERILALNRNSREREILNYVENVEKYNIEAKLPANKFIENFQKYLNSEENKLFLSISQKFDDYFYQEMEKVKVKYEGEMKILKDELENEKNHEIDTIKSSNSIALQKLQQELESKHGRDLENLRKYFEQKCADLEKQYSEEVFSQKSQKNSNDSSSELSDQDNFSEEGNNLLTSSPKNKRTQAFYSSPTHCKSTPITISSENQKKSDNYTTSDNIVTEKKSEITFEEINKLCKAKVEEISKAYEEKIKRLYKKLKRFEERYADDGFMKEEKCEYDAQQNEIQSNKNIDSDNEIHKIVAEYDRRLNEQVNLAKEDLMRDIENHIQALLSETTIDDQQYPPELILLREKFTAKSQLEIAQLQIKHEEEMSRVKAECDEKLNRRIKRNTSFDLNRDLKKTVAERDYLRELTTIFRKLLSQLAKYVSANEENLNNTLFEELYNHGIFNDDTSINKQFNEISDIYNESNRLRFRPELMRIISVIEDPSLIEFISKDSCDISSFNIQDCLDKLQNEANGLLKLSKILSKGYDNKDDSMINNKTSFIEEDNNKDFNLRQSSHFFSTHSLNEIIYGEENIQLQTNNASSLPIDTNQVKLNETIPSTNDINFHVNELKNRLVKCENERKILSENLETIIEKNRNLEDELNTFKEQLKQNDSQRDDYSEGYGISQIKSPPRIRSVKVSTSFTKLQEKARNYLTTPTKSLSENSPLLLQLIEDFCREGDKILEYGKKERNDLQSQIDAADKQLKSTRNFLEDQANERELERDDFNKEIQKYKTQIREKEREYLKENELMDQQIKDLTQQNNDLNNNTYKLETELKASIEKIFSLRNIIADLETKIEFKAVDIEVLNEKVMELESYTQSLIYSNEQLRQEFDGYKSKINKDYQQKIASLEEQLRNDPNDEQTILLEHLTEQLRDIETTLDQKIKTLESLHQNINSGGSSHSEDISKNIQATISPQCSPDFLVNQPNSIPKEEIQRIFEKLTKHTRAEEAAIKKIKDMDMHISHIKTNYMELQHERNALQEKISEYSVKISSLQTKLDEQRHRAEELHRHSSSDYAIRIHDLQNEVFSLKETLSTREKQIAKLKNQLEQSKTAIERLEAELALGIQSDRSTIEKLNAEIKQKTDENQKLKDKIKNEMITKLALPDLMETMLSDKNEEIDHLKEQLDSKKKELKEVLDNNSNHITKGSTEKSCDQSEAKLSARTLSDIGSISEYDAPDIIRKAQSYQDSSLPRFHPAENTLDLFKNAPITQKHVKTAKQVNKFNNPINISTDTQTCEERITITPIFVPRQINFSEFISDSKNKNSTPKIVELTNAEEELLQLKDELEIAQTKYADLKLTLETLESEKSAELFQARNEIKESNEKYNRLNKMKNDLEQNNLELKEKLANLNNIYIESSKREQDMIKQIENLNEKINEKSTEGYELKNRIDHLLIENKELTKKLAENYNMLIKKDKEENDNLIKYHKEIFNYQKNDINSLDNFSNLQENLNTSHDLKQSTEIISKLSTELNLVRAELSEKIVQYEKSLLDIQSKENQIKELTKIINQKTDELTSKESKNNITEMSLKLASQEEKNCILHKQIMKLEKEIEKLRSQSNESSKRYSLDEIAERVEKELNYSAQLDSNILKAIESEDENNLDKNKVENKMDQNDLYTELQITKLQLEAELANSNRLKQLVEHDKVTLANIQQQDANLIQVMQSRLESAFDKEKELMQNLDEERQKCENLMAQISGLQRYEARKVGYLLKSPPDSPKRSNKSNEFEIDFSEQLKSELKLLKAQNEREKERAADLQKALEREKKRFLLELSEHIEYGEKLKHEIEKLINEKNTANQEIEDIREKLFCALHEVESLETRLSSFQEAEYRRAQRSNKEQNENRHLTIEMNSLKNKIASLETERDHLNNLIDMLRHDISCHAQREAKLTVLLANGESALPEQFISKIKEINSLLTENTKENRQMSKTLFILNEERKLLQKRCEELETGTNNYGATYHELEDRAGHILAKYLKAESHRKALSHQKRYLLIVLKNYEENELKALNLLNRIPNTKEKRKTLKSVALVMVAIQRMKFVVKRWQAGRKLAPFSNYDLRAQRHIASGMSYNTLNRPIEHIILPHLDARREDDANENINRFLSAPCKTFQSPIKISRNSERCDLNSRKKN